MMSRKPTHPGEVFKDAVLIPLEISVTQAAKNMGVSRKALSEVLNGHRSLSPEMAVRMARATETSPESWSRMQDRLNLWKAENSINERETDIIPFPHVSRKEILEG
jgi:addiction module HigA family antidote